MRGPKTEKHPDGEPIPYPQPAELALLWLIDRFGVEPIMGRRYLYAGETMQMRACEGIVNGYKGMIQSKDRAEWTAENPDAAALLVELEQMADND